MAYLKDVFGRDLFRDFDKFYVGFDDTYNRIAKMYDEYDDLTKSVPNYPPYNIRKTGDNTYSIELAVAGFAKQDIEITFEDNKLIIAGNSNDDKGNFLFKGIATRAFTRTFLLDEKIEILDAALVNGMLKIALERVVPEHKKPKKIEVKETEEQKLLTENSKKYIL